MDEPSRRTQLADRFANYPLISMFILSPAFPLTVAGLMILAGLIALCIPKLWVTTPPGFSPKIKVSVLDLAQAAVLRNRARKHEAAGDFERAHHAWQSAIANNGGDVGLLADSLKNLLRIHNPPREFIETAVSQALWFMRLTGTNDLALDIVPAVFVKCRIPEYTVSILRRFDPPLPPVRETAMLKALFLTGRIDEYHRRKEEFGKSLPQDPELDLCEAGYVAGWGPPEKSQQALRAISEGMEDRNLYEFAARVQLVVATKTHDIARYEAALNRLRENETDSLTDHVGYWKLLEAAGRQAEARQLAQSYPKVPSSAMEAVLYSSALVSLGALEHAQKFFERYAPVVANSDNPDLGSIWVGYAELLIQMRKWDELQALAVQLRTLHPTRTILTGYSYFLDGRAALARGRADEAAANFSKCADEPFHVPAAAMHAARSLFLLGHGDLAKRIVEPLEAALANDVEYWQLLFDIEYARKEDETSLLRAAIKARELDPDRLMRQVNYAAALLINRQNPSEAINITLGFYQAYPQSLVAKINHSFALALNNRYTEAADILTKIAPSSLRETELTVYHYCWLEVHYGLRQLDLAAEDLKQINPKLLFPSQVKRVDQVRAEIESARATTFQRSN